MAGWGDDPQLAELRTLVYEDGWTPVSVTEGAGAVDTVVVEKDGEQTLLQLRPHRVPPLRRRGQGGLRTVGSAPWPTRRSSPTSRWST